MKNVKRLSGIALLFILIGTPIFADSPNPSNQLPGKDKKGGPEGQWACPGATLCSGEPCQKFGNDAQLCAVYCRGERIGPSS